MTLVQFLDFILEFEGIIGAILGVTFTLIISHYLKNRGKVKVVLIASTCELYAWNDFGNYTEGVSLSEAKGVSVNFNIEIYNESESPKYLNNFRLKVYNNNEVLVDLELESLDSRRVVSGRTLYDSIDHLNLEPKKIFKQSLCCNIDFEEYPELKDFSKFYFAYTNENNKVKAILLFDKES